MKRTLILSVTASLALALSSCSSAVPIPVKLQQTGGKWQLLRDGKPYFIKGAGGDGDKVALLATGANSSRTWGADGIDNKLDEAQKLGMTVTVGMWLGHKEHGFDYHNKQAVADQLENCKRAIDKYKNHPAVLMWSVGNEMEMQLDENDPAVWLAVEEIAAYAKKVDPNHPTMTVVAEIGGNKVANINKYCPSIDVIGINTYGGGPSIAERYPKAGGVKPYVLTEFGPPGTWESGKNAWGVVPELTSTEKAARYAETWKKTIANQPLSLGGYAFTWGNKQEASATWYGMLLPNGERLAAVDTMQELWSGKPPANRVPEIKAFKVTTPARVQPGATVRAELDVVDPEKDPLKVQWILQLDPATYSVGGATEAVPPTYPEAIVKSDNGSVEVRMPRGGGAYRLFAMAHDNHNGAAVGNISLFVEGNEKPAPPKATKLSLPFDLYKEAGEEARYVASGYMGDVGNIKMTVDDTTKPHTGKTALKAQYTSGAGWGGVVWQSPANDWGAKPGGYDLTGSNRVTFWARGENGGESVSFSLGLIGKEQPYPDTGKGNLDKVILSKDWKQYEISLDGQDLSRIKTGFAWVVGAHGQPITFYLDDIRYEKGDTMNVKKFVATAAVAAGMAGGGAKAAEQAKLPFSVYAEAGDKLSYIPSGYMGDAGNIKMTEDDTTTPHTGKTVIKAQYTTGGGWGGVVWQSPANDWGEQPGGLNLTGAKKLTFWARGEKGGEKVSFSFGILDKAKYPDSGKGEIKDQELTKEWKQFEIDLTGKDLSQIKTGFVWVLGAKGEPVTFYLDDITYQ
ncbi:MAG TPA: glycoside hydrolase family 2 TIM barrel-domain containing protein [Abditibacteriaceae bacterium]|jgi:hypothetical protein